MPFNSLTSVPIDVSHIESEDSLVEMSRYYNIAGIDKHHRKRRPTNYCPAHSLTAIPNVQVQALKGNAYRRLQTLVHEIEETARLKISAATKKARRRGKTLPIASEFVFFEQVMAKVQARTGVGEAQWVLKEHEDAHYDAAR